MEKVKERAVQPGQASWKAQARFHKPDDPNYRPDVAGFAFGAPSLAFRTDRRRVALVNRLGLADDARLTGSGGGRE